MKRLIAYCLLLSLLLCACGQFTDETQPNLTVEPSSEPSTEPTTEATEEKHSPYYIPGYTAEDIAREFQAVALSVENPLDATEDATSHVRKWAEPISYQILGSPSEEDRTLVRSFAAELNGVAGIPEIREAGNGDIPNYTITFCPLEAFLQHCPGESALTNGYVTIWWYNDNLQVHQAEIFIRSDIDRETRSRTILHEMYQSLGLLQDSRHPDSIIYSDTLEADFLSALDWTVLEILYDGEITLGMDYGECLDVIRRIYF